MRLNQFLAHHTGLSRRAADRAITQGLVTVNHAPGLLGQVLSPGDSVSLNGNLIQAQAPLYLALNKPTGYICSRRHQGQAPTIYALLPSHYHKLKPVGRLDKDTSGLIILTNDGVFAQTLTHPKHLKLKRYTVQLDKKITSQDVAKLQHGIKISDGISQMQAALITDHLLEVSLTEGRNRQIRRTFEALGYRVTSLQRTNFGLLELGDLKLGQYRIIEPKHVI